MAVTSRANEAPECPDKLHQVRARAENDLAATLHPANEIELVADEVAKLCSFTRV